MDNDNKSKLVEGIHAPYNFVPLSKWVYKPDWADQVSHDHPLADGISGTIEIEITAHTPLLVGGERKTLKNQPQQVHFYTLPGPDGDYAIPGSSLKGMIRNVMEIACFSKMKNIDDIRFGVRDTKKCKTGFLHYNEKQGYVIQPCSYAKISHELLKKEHTSWAITTKNGNSAELKYKRWQKKKDLEVTFESKKGQYCDIVTKLNSKKKGTLVFTGQTGLKKNEFVFYEKQGEALNISDEVMKSFLDIYGDSDAWSFIKKEFNPIPIFYINDNKNKVTSFGLSNMFKQPYKHTTHDLLANNHEEHINNIRYDLTEMLFGAINEDKVTPTSLKGRVNFSTATITETPGSYESFTTVLSGPKSSYYPNYIEQISINGETLKNNSEYNTYKHEGSKLRGWKYYPAHAEPWQDKVPSGTGNNSMDVQLHPLPSGISFKGKIRLHNINPIELGALLWAITWDEKENRRHRLGMGKAFGFGQVSITTNENSWKNLIPNNPNHPIHDIHTYINNFKLCMGINYSHSNEEHKKHDGKTWSKSKQIKNILAMSNPKASQNRSTEHPLWHMPLEEYANKKNIKKGPCFVLPEYLNIK